VLTGLGRVLAGATGSHGDPALDPALVSQASKLAEADGRGEVVERLLDRYVSAYMKDRDTGSAGGPLARLMADLAAPPHTSTPTPPVLVYDPCCGTGFLLAAAVHEVRPHSPVRRRSRYSSPSWPHASRF
jgi:type I restriction-modification system DNA methylase subunit